MTYDELRAEFSSSAFRRKLKKELGTTCCNCDCTKNIEYHHIVPLTLGGTNKFTNIVPLCQECHYKAHEKRVVKNYKGGRPKKFKYEDIKDIVDDYFNCRIGKSEACRLIGMKPGNKSTWYIITKEYKEENGIVTSRNNIDIILSNKLILANEGPELSENRILGYIKYKNGRKIEFTKAETIAINHRERGDCIEKEEIF